MKRRPAAQVGTLVVGSVLQIVLFIQFWRAMFAEGTDPVTGDDLDSGAAFAAMIVVGVIYAALLALVWWKPGGTASGVLVVLSALTAIGSFSNGEPAVGAGYLVAALCFLVAPWFKRRA